VQREAVKKDANLVILPLPMSDASKTDVFDYMGVTKTIDVEGIYVGNNIGSIAGWIGSMSSLVDGQQTGPSTYVSTIIGSNVIKIWYFNYDWIQGDPNKVSYSLRMIESTETS